MILRMVSIPLASVAERLFSISEMVDLFNPAAAANCCWFIPASARAARNWSPVVNNLGLFCAKTGYSLAIDNQQNWG